MKLCPELQYWCNHLIVTGSLNKFDIPFPSKIDQSVLNTNSFIDLLFNEEYPHTNYTYLYRIVSGLENIPKSIKERVSVYPTSIEYYVSVDDDSQCNVNLFELSNIDLMMLDGLLQYRMNPASIQLEDTTSVENVEIIDGTSYITILVNYQNLTVLSKLIYHYLNLKINDICFEYSMTNPLSTNNLLETLYEVFLIEQLFKALSQKGT